MDKSRLEILPSVWLDHRRAVFLESESILAVADLHLGYAWAHRYHGQMLPLHTPDDLLARLSELCAFYKPKHLAFLGDIIHQAVPVPEIANELATLFEKLSAICGLKLILGNHDKKLKKIAQDQNLKFLTHFETGHFLLTHGNDLVEAPPGKTVIMGHEHPAISLGDGIASAKFPCFMFSGIGGHRPPLQPPLCANGNPVAAVYDRRPSPLGGLLILPAFSLWAAGTNIRAYPFMSPIAQRATFTKAIAICGKKLLPIKL